MRGLGRGCRHSEKYGRMTQLTVVGQAAASENHITLTYPTTDEAGILSFLRVRVRLPTPLQVRVRLPPKGRGIPGSVGVDAILPVVVLSVNFLGVPALHVIRLPVTVCQLLPDVIHASLTVFPAPMGAVPPMRAPFAEIVAFSRHVVLGHVVDGPDAGGARCT